MAQIYLISPPKIDINDFPEKLEIALKTGKVPVFQLRLKNYLNDEIIQIGKKLLTICRKYKTLFILNDDLDLALKVGADGVHLGSEDQNIALVRKNSPKNFIIGASCYDSRHLAVEAIEAGADYVSFGTFFTSQTKNSKGKPTTEILKWASEVLNVQIVAIGGINDSNAKILSDEGADFVAVISDVWDNPKGIEEAINSLDKAIN